ncbi:hypothetical protein H6F61_25975 [Cyanobacteria bacterium FACHB-472]|nr:hypothetical protein [Cyanobacteria bacterium FACHB-472]
MSAVPQSVASDRRLGKRKPDISSRQPKGGVPSRTSSRRTQKPAFQAQSPGWLRSLAYVQRVSDILCFGLIAATLGIYAWTVYTQQTWSRQYKHLETLQRNERQMTAANEVLKDKLAQEAERPGTGLVSPNPANTIFLAPAPQRQSLPTPAATANPEPAPTMPMGY